MAETSPSAVAANNPLQFDTAEFSSAGSLAGELGCSACKQPLLDTYYEVNGQKACAACKDATIAVRSGSPVAAFIRASIYGMLAGIAGCAIYYAVLALTGLHVGLISIAVGLMVGIAVRNGSGQRGGWLYQAMAMFITYGSIVTSFVPEIVSDMRMRGPNGLRELPTAVLAVFAWIEAWFAPFFSLPQNIIGVLIIAFGVYEAWQINKRQPLEITGPFTLVANPPLGAPVAGSTNAPLATS